MHVTRSFLGLMGLAVFGSASALGCGGLLAGSDSGDEPGATITIGDDGGPPASGSGGSNADASSKVDAILATGLITPRSLVVVGDRLFWTEQADGDLGVIGSIKSVGVGGGTPTTVQTSPGLNTNLTSDGKSLYFTSGGSVPFSGTTLFRCGLDGANLTTFGAAPINAWPGPDSQIFFANGGLFMGSGGEPAEIRENGSVVPFGPMSTPSMGTLYGTDGTNLFFREGPQFQIWSVGGGAAIDFFDQPSSQDASNDALAVVSGDVYLMTTGDSTAISKIHAAAGNVDGPVQLTSLTDWFSRAMAADANGLYVTQSVTTNAPGIYSVSTTTGATTLVKEDPSGSAYDLTLDAKNVYWFESPDVDHAHADLHARSR